MKNSIVKFDVNNEFYIRPFNQGIKLIHPNEQVTIGNSQLLQVSAIMNFACNVAFINSDNEHVRVNEIAAQRAGFESISDAVGRTLSCVATKESAEISHHQNLNILKTETMNISDYTYTRAKDDAQFASVILKFPWYNEDNKINGILVFAIIINPHEPTTLANTLSNITQAGLLVPRPRELQIAETYLTNREKDILKLLIYSLPTKEIAKRLKLSPRTVEEYIHNLKIKFNVQYKHELMEKLAEHYWNI